MLSLPKIIFLLICLTYVANATHNVTRHRKHHHKRHRKITTTTVAPLTDDDYDVSETEELPSVEDPKNETSIPEKKPSKHLPAKSQKRINDDWFGPGALTGFFRSIGFSLTLGQKNGLNLRIGPHVGDEDPDKELPPLPQSKKKVTTTTPDPPLPPFIPLSTVSPVPDYSPMEVAASVQHIRPAVIHPRA